jgi:hypothetical protein
MKSLGPELSVELFPPVTWRGVDATDWLDADYPGLRPIGSWHLTPDGALHGLDAAGDEWHDRETGEPVAWTGRHLILAYGSNPDPAKLLARPDFFGGDSVIALRSAVFGWAAAWCDARRGIDGSVVATLVPEPGRVEVHPVFALTAHQLERMDAWEGHPQTYKRLHHQGAVVLESGQLVDDVEVYLGTAEQRPTLLCDGRHLRVADVEYSHVDGLVD